MRGPSAPTDPYATRLRSMYEVFSWLLSSSILAQEKKTIVALPLAQSAQTALLLLDYFRPQVLGLLGTLGWSTTSSIPFVLCRPDVIARIFLKARTQFRGARRVKSNATARQLFPERRGVIRDERTVDPLGHQPPITTR